MKSDIKKLYEGKAPIENIIDEEFKKLDFVESVHFEKQIIMICNISFKAIESECDGEKMNKLFSKEMELLKRYPNTDSMQFRYFPK